MPRREDPWHTIEVVKVDCLGTAECCSPRGCDSPDGWYEVEILDHGGCPVSLVKDDWPYRCQTEHDLFEFWGNADWADLGEGRHRVRAWTSGPDYHGEYDGGVEVHPDELG